VCSAKGVQDSAAGLSRRLVACGLIAIFDAGGETQIACPARSSTISGARFMDLAYGPGFKLLRVAHR